MMPGILTPALNIAIRVGSYPLIIRRVGRSGILGKIPRARPAIALEAENHGLPIWHHLIHIHLKVRDRARPVTKVNPSVVYEVFSIGIVTKGSIVTLSAVIRIGGIEPQGIPAERWRSSHPHCAGRGAVGSRIVVIDPIAKGL